MRILAAFLTLGLSTPAFADDAACMAAPTQACVFDMARAAAHAADSLQDNVTGLLAVAAFQESAGDLQASAATIDQIIALTEAREPDVAKRHALLNWAALAGSERVAAAPVLAMRMVNHLGSEGSALKTSLRFAALAGDTETVSALLDATPSIDLDDFTLIAATNLMVRGDYVQAYALGDRNRTPAFRQLLDETAVTLLLRAGRIEAAEVVAAGMADPAGRAAAIMNVAQDLAQRGDIAKAKAYADVAGELSGNISSPYTTLTRAGILALAGDSAGAEALIATLNPSELPPGAAEQVRLLSAILAGDKAATDALVAGFDRPIRAALAVKGAALVCLEAATCEPAQVLTATEGPALEGALNAIGLVQARAGKSAEALATLEQLRALGPDARVTGDFRAALVLLLADEGQVPLALELAAEGQNALVLAELASRL